jgi:hypothetical protein
LPAWVQGSQRNGFLFVDQGPKAVSAGPAQDRRPGYYLAICQQGNLALLEAFDTWLHPGLSLDDFATDVIRRNADVGLLEDQEFQYTTWNGNRIHAVIWSRSKLEPTGRRTSAFGAEVRRIEYGDGDPTDRMGDAGNVTGQFLSGTVMNSPAEAVVEIKNPFLGTTIRLDMADPWHPRRTAETGETEEAGSNHEVWLDFQWLGASEGDACRPFKTLAIAASTVAEHGVIKIVPGTTNVRGIIGGGKRFRMVAPAGGVIIGAPQPDPGAVRDAGSADGGDAVRKTDVWVEFDFSDTAYAHIAGPFNQLPKAIAAVADGGIIRIVPGATKDRSTIGSGKRFRLQAPIGGVTIGSRG